MVGVNEEIPPVGPRGVRGGPDAATKALPYRPSWVPRWGHHLWRCGVHFDVLRMYGERGEATVRRLVVNVGERAGPVVGEATGFRWTYFLLAPGTAREHVWPVDVQRYAGPRTVVYIGVPALQGNTWPLGWSSRPTRDAPFVDPGELLRALSECPVPPPPGPTPW